MTREELIQRAEEAQIRYLMNLDYYSSMDPAEQEAANEVYEDALMEQDYNYPETINANQVDIELCILDTIPEEWQ